MKGLVPGFLKKKDDKYVGFRTNVKLGSDDVVPFVELLEATVRRRMKNTVTTLKIVDNKLTNDVVEHFRDGFRNRTALDKADMNALWSAAIKIIKQSDPIFSDRNCTTLQTASSEDVSQIASYLPLHHKQILGTAAHSLPAAFFLSRFLLIVLFPFLCRSSL